MPPNPLVLPDQVVDRLWHIPFNQLKETNEKLVWGRQDIFYGAEFSASAGTNKPDELLTTGEEMAWLLQYRTSVQASAFTGSLSPPPCDREQYRLFRKEPCLGELGW